MSKIKYNDCSFIVSTPTSISGITLQPPSPCLPPTHSRFIFHAFYYHSCGTPFHFYVSAIHPLIQFVAATITYNAEVDFNTLFR
ncbi:unnamed protein product, partial [Ceratitis capitata]